MGDSSLIGCGCYADNRSAAVSTTGWGEPMMKLVLAKWTADRVEAGQPPQEAAQQALFYLKVRLNGHGGIIIVDTRGRIGIAHNTPQNGLGRLQRNRGRRRALRSRADGVEAPRSAASRNAI